MKHIIKIAAMLALMTMAACGQDDKPVKTTDTDLLKTQRDALEQAKQVEKVLEDAAAQQRQDIGQSTQ